MESDSLQTRRRIPKKFSLLEMLVVKELIDKGISLSQIAIRLKRPNSSIMQLVNKNGGREKFCPHATQEAYKKRFQENCQKKKEKYDRLRTEKGMHKMYMSKRIQHLEMQMEIMHDTVRSLLNDRKN